jgi:hypothetical protein
MRRTVTPHPVRASARLPRLRALFTGLLATLAAACGGTDAVEARERYIAVEGGNRLMDRASKQYVLVHCEIRVPLARALPDPISSSETGDRLSAQYLTSVTMETAGFDKHDQRIADGWRTWLWRDTPDLAWARGTGRLAIASRWNDDEPLHGEPTEIFNLPKLDAYPPWVWSPWRRADALRAGDFAVYDALQDRGTEAALAPPEHPFEVRCRVVLSDSPVVPGAADDPAIDRPEPDAAEQARLAVDPLATAADPSVQRASRAGRAVADAVQRFLIEYLSGPTGSRFVAGNAALAGDALTPDLAAAVRVRLASGDANAAGTSIDPFTGLDSAPLALAAGAIRETDGGWIVRYDFQHAGGVVSMNYRMVRVRGAWRIDDVAAVDAASGLRRADAGAP